MLIYEGVVFIHIGPHKTASTSLQNSIFPNVDLYYASDKIPGFNLWLERFARVNPTMLERSSAYIEASKYIRALPVGRKVLISSENLFGSIYLDYSDNYIIFNNLKRLFPNLKIVFFARLQSNFFESLYRQAVREYLPVKSKTYIDFHEVNVNYKRLRSIFNVNYKMASWLSYYKFFKHYLGGDRVKVLLYEDLQSDKNYVLKEIEAFFGCRINSELTHDNAGVGSEAAFIIKMLGPLPLLIYNKVQSLKDSKFKSVTKIILGFVSHQIRNISFGRNIKARLPESTKIDIDNYYAKENAELSELLCLQDKFKEYGYCYHYSR